MYGVLCVRVYAACRNLGEKRYYLILIFLATCNPYLVTGNRPYTLMRGRTIALRVKSIFYAITTQHQRTFCQKTAACHESSSLSVQSNNSSYEVKVEIKYHYNIGLI